MVVEDDEDLLFFRTPGVLLKVSQVLEEYVLVDPSSLSCAPHSPCWCASHEVVIEVDPGEDDEWWHCISHGVDGTDQRAQLSSFCRSDGAHLSCSFPRHYFLRGLDCGHTRFIQVVYILG